MSVSCVSVRRVYYTRSVMGDLRPYVVQVSPVYLAYPYCLYVHSPLRLP